MTQIRQGNELQAINYRRTRNLKISIKPATYITPRLIVIKSLIKQTLRACDCGRCIGFLLKH